MSDDEETKLLSAANRLVAQRRWGRAGLRTRLMTGQQLKMSRIRKRGHLLCLICDQAMMRDLEGKYIHVNKRRNKDHLAEP